MNTENPQSFILKAVKELAAIREGANKRGNTSRLTQSFHFFMFEPIFSPVNALNQPI
ncbi:type IV secretory pathway VirB6 component (fragment) [Escherichia coli]|uniref:Type IV secretory pathway VirB6 component n=1 Tax=Escherichia coli TaxID=562 RepID=A0A376U2V5_ECOLX